MAFQQGLSGLNAASKALDATSHNIANSSTVGFKASSAHFGDVYAASLAGGGASQVGIGVNLTAIQQQFTQGNITSTNNPLDISINGAGFFKMDQNGATTYTRNGQFHLDKNGYIVNDQSMKLTGYAAPSGIVVPSTPQPIQISASDLPPIETGTSTSSGFTGVKANLQLDSRAKEPIVSPWVPAVVASAGPPPVTAATLYTPDPQSYNFSTAISIYDSLGNSHALTMYMVKTPTPGQWEARFNVDGTSDAYVSPQASPVNFDSTGKLISAPVALTINLASVNSALNLPSNATSPMTFDVNFTGSTQFGSAFGTNRLEQDGYAAGRLVGLSVGADGIIKGRYSNGQNFAQGQIVMANFTNPNGLQSLGNNQWVETSVSGAAMLGAPNTSSLGALSSSTVEESNVDLTAELVNLITQQRNYQANAQSIKTQDQIMQTLVNLR